jgi:type I site-specific restriction endonuclease
MSRIDELEKGIDELTEDKLVLLTRNNELAAEGNTLRDKYLDLLDRKDDLQEAIDAIPAVKTKQDLAPRVTELEQENRELVEDRKVLLERNRELLESSNAVIEEATKRAESTDRAMQDLALRLAMAMLRSKIEGITYNDIETLRGR